MTRRDKPRELSDADHEEILNNPKADEALATIAIERAVRRGLTREEAKRLYGTRR